MYVTFDSKTKHDKYSYAVYLDNKLRNTSSLPVAGANVGGQCSASSEAAGVAAQGGWPTTQRDGGVAEHAKLDL